MDMLSFTWNFRNCIQVILLRILNWNFDFNWNTISLSVKPLIIKRKHNSKLPWKNCKIRYVVSYLIIRLPLNAEKKVHLDLPSSMFSQWIMRYSSRSGRLCSCSNPKTWRSSWRMVPKSLQPIPRDIIWKQLSPLLK